MVYRSFHYLGHSFLQFASIHSVSSSQLLQESIRTATQAKAYQQIPGLLNASKISLPNPNPFSFLSDFSHDHRIQVIKEILHSFIPLRPRSCLQIAYSFLLFHTLQTPSPLPIALAILQHSLRSGCIPVPQTHRVLSTAWLDRRKQSQSVSNILQEMKSIGYVPDCGTCNYIISSLCKVDQLKEAVKVIQGMHGAGCIPDLDSYGIVIGALCKLRRTVDVVQIMKDMVIKYGLTPRQELLVEVVNAMRANKELWRAVEVIEFLEREGLHVGFKGYEVVVEGCLECGEFVLSGKVVMRMTDKGFIPYIRVRQKVVEELANAGEWELAYAVRQRLADLKS